MRNFILVLIVIALICPSVFGSEVAKQKWVARYNGPYNSDDYAQDLAVNSLGNVYVTGYSYDSNSSWDFTTIKYDVNGNQLWTARYNGLINNNDFPTELSLDSSDNVYVTGNSADNNGLGALATVKYSPDGNQLWAARYNWPENGWGEARVLAVDSSGNVYVTGFDSNGTITDFVTIQYAPDGNQLWAAHYNGPYNSEDYPDDLAIDTSSNVYVTGYSYDNNTASADYATIKYDTNGNQLWVTLYNGPANNEDRASALAVDSLGYVYVTGNSYDLNTATDFVTIKYDPNGNQLWAERYNGPGNSEDYAIDLAVDSLGNIYVTGTTYDSNGVGDYATVKYDVNGNQLWMAPYNGPDNGDDSALDVAVDNSGNVYVTGSSNNSYGSNSDYATVKYDPNGNQLWAERYNGPGNDYDSISALALDSSWNVYVTGYSIGNGTGYDYTTIKYTQVNCVNPVGDLNNDCKVDFKDFAVLASHWLECNYAFEEDCW